MGKGLDWMRDNKHDLTTFLVAIGLLDGVDLLSFSRLFQVVKILFIEYK